MGCSGYLSKDKNVEVRFFCYTCRKEIPMAGHIWYVPSDEHENCEVNDRGYLKVDTEFINYEER